MGGRSRGRRSFPAEGREDLSRWGRGPPRGGCRDSPSGRECEGLETKDAGGDLHPSGLQGVCRCLLAGRRESWGRQGSARGQRAGGGFGSARRSPGLRPGEVSSRGSGETKAPRIPLGQGMPRASSVFFGGSVLSVVISWHGCARLGRCGPTHRSRAHGGPDRGKSSWQRLDLVRSVFARGCRLPHRVEIVLRRLGLRTVAALGKQAVDPPGGSARVRCPRLPCRRAPRRRGAPSILEPGRSIFPESPPSFLRGAFMVPDWPATGLVPEVARQTLSPSGVRRRPCGENDLGLPVAHSKATVLLPQREMRGGIGLERWPREGARNPAVGARPATDPPRDSAGGSAETAPRMNHTVRAPIAPSGSFCVTG